MSPEAPNAFILRSCDWAPRLPLEGAGENMGHPQKHSVFLHFWRPPKGQTPFINGHLGSQSAKTPVF